MKRLVFAGMLVLTALEIGVACSEQVPLGTIGTKCEYDEQCQRGLSCKCIRRRNPDDEGPDEILEPGFCADSTDGGSFKGCPRDGGVADTAFDAPPPVDTTPPPVDALPETTTDAAEDTLVVDAADGG